MKKLKFFLAPLAMVFLMCWGGGIGCSTDDESSESAPIENPDNDKEHDNTIEEIKAPVIESVSENATVLKGTELSLFVTAKSLDGGELSYQWYFASNEDSEGTKIDGATTASYSFSSADTTKYYYVVVTNTKNGKNAQTKSSVITVTITDSSDLPDVGTTDVSQLYVKGTLPGLTWDDDVQIGNDTATAKTPFVRQDDGSYVWEFVAESSSAVFAFDIGGWTETYRGTASGELFEGFDADFDTGAVEGVLYPHDDANCMPITMEAGASYKMTVTGGAGTVICKIEKTKDAINMKLVTPDESIALTPVNATDVQYAFTPEKDGEMKFYVVRNSINIAPDSDRELELGVPFASKADFTSTEPTGWYKFQYKANIPYKVVVSYTEESISITAGYSFVAAGFESIGWGRNSFETGGDGYGWTESFNATAIEYDRIEDGYAYYKPVEFSVTNDATIGADIALRNNGTWTVRYELGGGEELPQDEWHKLEKGLDPGNGRAYIKFAAQEGKVADKIKVSYRENLSDNSVEVSYTVVYK